FPVKGVQQAGHPMMRLPDPESALEVTTGSVLPNGADCVIRKEDVEYVDSVIVVSQALAPAPFDNIQRQGCDHRKNARLVQPPIRLSPPEIAIAASVGLQFLEVTRQPRISIVSTGDEVISGATQPN